LLEIHFRRVWIARLQGLVRACAERCRAALKTAIHRLIHFDCSWRKNAEAEPAPGIISTFSPTLCIVRWALIPGNL
jgi:hypothetical protein